MKWKDSNYRPELGKGESFFAIRYYVTNSIGYKIVVSAKDRKEAKKYFEDHFNAELHSIRKGTY